MGTAVMAISDDDFFYMERHQLIWNALCSLNKAVTPIDPVTLSAELTKMGKLDIVGGREYIFELMESVASSANVPWQLEHLRSKAVLRKLIRTSSEIIRQAMDPASTPDNVLQDAERDIFAIADNQVRNTLKSIHLKVYRPLRGASSGAHQQSQGRRHYRRAYGHYGTG